MSLSNPIIDFQIKPAFEKQTNEAQKILVIAQLTTGTATPGTVVSDIGNANEQDTLFGANSMAATAVRAIKRITKETQVDVLPLADGSTSVAATGKVAFSGTAGANGTLYVKIGSAFNNIYEVSVAETDTAADIVTAFAALINADATAVVDAIANVGDLELTANNKGATGNFIGIGASGEVDSISYTITAMSGGTGEPDSITDKTAFNAISSSIRYQGIVYPQTYAVVSDYEGLAEFLDARFNVNNRILDGNTLIVNTDTLANLKTLATAVDNKSITIFGNKPVVDTARLTGSAIFELDYVIAAYFAAIRALRLTPNAQIGEYVVGTNGALDDVGGAALASLPYMNTPFGDFLPVALVTDFWTDIEVDELLTAGISVIGNNRDNNEVIAGQVVTTYLTDAASNQDPTFKYLNYFDTLTNIREYFFNNLKARFAQSRLADGKVIPLRNMANADVIKAALLNFYGDLESLALVESGRAARKFFSANLNVTIDKTSGLATVAMLVSPVVQLRRLNIVMQVVFNVNL